MLEDPATEPFDGLPDGTIVGRIPLPDPMPTNVALDETDETLYATLGTTGRLVAVDGWLEAARREVRA